MSGTSTHEMDISAVAEKLIASIASLGDAVVAFSGGVDSGVVAVAAHRALGPKAVAVQGTGEAVSTLDRDAAEQLTRLCGIRFVAVNTSEIEDPNYVRNDSRRCYYCKSTLYRTLREWANTNGFRNILSGTNSDDLGDYRPGLEAAEQFHIIAPLAQSGINKNQVRALARHFGLPIADKPASPCLASRIAYGQEVTRERLRLIERGEEMLHQLGFHDVRVRLHADNLVRLELHESNWSSLTDPSIKAKICEHFLAEGVHFVTMDLMSRQTGSLNRMLPVLR